MYIIFFSFTIFKFLSIANHHETAMLGCRQMKETEEKLISTQKKIRIWIFLFIRV